MELENVKLTSSMKKDDILKTAKEVKERGLALLNDNTLLRKEYLELNNKVIAQESLISNLKININDLEELIKKIRDMIEDFSWWKIFGIIKEIKILIDKYKNDTI